MKKVREVESVANADQSMPERSSAFSPILASFAGGASIGGTFGIPGVFVGGVIGGFIGYLVNKKYCD